MRTLVSRKIALAVLILLAAHPAWAQRASGGSGDPTVKPVGDPHGAIKAMSEASQPNRKPDHAVASVPDVVPATSGDPASGGTK